MTKLTVLWIGIVSIIAVLIIFLFGGNVFSECYGQNAVVLSLGIPQFSPMVNCDLYTGIIVFLLLFLGSVLATLVVYAIYVLIFNRPMSTARYLLWLIWFIILYFVIFELTLLPPI